jgi:hypothetical protein
VSWLVLHGPKVLQESQRLNKMHEASRMLLAKARKAQIAAQNHSNGDWMSTGTFQLIECPL